MIEAKGSDTVIYQIRNILNNKVYVGSAFEWNKRKSAHKTRLAKNNHHSAYLQAAWNKYGSEAFVFEVLEILGDRSKENVIAKEQQWIDSLKSYEKANGYNVRRYAYSPLGSTHSPETKAKLLIMLSSYHDGSDNPSAKLNEDDIIYIKELLADGHTYKEIGAHFGVAASTIGSINQNRVWSDIGEPCKPRNGTAKLTKEQVIEIRELIRQGITQEAIAQRYGVKRPTIGSIAQRKSWANVP